jgi:hypothetical protein
LSVSRKCQRLHCGARALMAMAVLWDVAPFSLVETDRRFRGSYCLHHLGAILAANLKPHLIACHSLFSILSFVTPFQLLNHLSGFHVTWYERYATPA